MHQVHMIVCLVLRLTFSSASLWLFRNYYFNYTVVNICNFCVTGGVFEDVAEIKQYDLSAVSPC